MKVLVLYRPNSEHGRLVEEFIHDFQTRHQDEHLEVLNIDTRDGSAMASLYDVVQYPAILVLQTDGYVQKIWEGEHLPLMDEVVSYAHN
jgi:3-deoxy-D-manno-octulosonic acid (KDO) 8-phosphate synthase